MKGLAFAGILLLLISCHAIPQDQISSPTSTPSPTSTFLPYSKPTNTAQLSLTPSNIPKPTTTTVSGMTSGNSTKDWIGSYYRNTTLTEPFGFERVDDEISFDWGVSSPAPNIPKDNFSISWIKCLNFKPRLYTLTAETNENTRLAVIVNNIFVFESDFGESGEVSVDFYGPAGNHCIKLELTHETGPAFVEFTYK